MPARPSSRCSPGSAQLEAVRRDLLDRALAFYREFLTERGRDSTARLETGRALARLGDIRELLGQYRQAESNYRDALEILGETPTNLETRQALARARVNLGILLKKSNRFTESETFLREGLKDRQALLLEHPDDADESRGVAQARYQLGTLLARLKNRSKEDEAAYLEAIAEQEALTQRPAATVEDRRELARYLNNLGILQSGSRRVEAEATFRKALAIQDEIQAQSIGSAGFRWQRARTWNNLAILLSRSRPAESESYYVKARQAFESLEADFPKVPEYRRERAITLNNLGLLLEAKPADVAVLRDLFDKALEDQRSLVTDFAEVPDHKLKLAVTYLHIGELLRPTDRSKAEAWFVEAIAIQEKLATDFPQTPEYQAALGRFLTERGSLLAEQDKPVEAIADIDRGITALDQARLGNPRELTYVSFLVEAHTDRAQILAKLGRHAELALEADRIIKLEPELITAHLRAAAFLAQCSLLAASDAPLKETYAQGAIKALRDAMNRGANDPAILDGPDFKSLKSRADFLKLREDWNAKGKKGTA